MIRQYRTRARSAVGFALTVLSLAGVGEVVGQERNSVPLESITVLSPGGPVLAFYRVPSDSAVAVTFVELVADHVPPPILGIDLPPDTFKVIIAPSEPAFRGLTGGRVPDWGLAVAFPRLGQIVVRSPRLVGGSGADPSVVLRHELNHLFLSAAAGPGADQIPRWFHEGFSAFYAQEWRWVDPYRLAWGRLTGAVRPLRELQDSIPSAPTPQEAYIQSMAAVRSLWDRGGDDGIRAFLVRLREGETFDTAMRGTFGMTLDQFYDDWESEMGREYGWLVAVSDQRGLWIIMAVAVALLYWVRRGWVQREIERRKRREDEMLGDPDDHSLGVEGWDRYWEHDDETWKGDDD